MRNYIYDGTIAGFFSLVFKIFEDKVENFKISKKNSINIKLGVENIFVDTNIDDSIRVIKKIRNDFSKYSLKNIEGAFYSEIEGCEYEIINYIKEGLKYKKNIDNHLEIASVSKVYKMSEKCYKEAHKIKGLMRFKEIIDGSLFSNINSTSNVLILIAPHFMARFPNEKWAIYDTKRKNAIIHINKKIEYIENFEINIDIVNEKIISEEENIYSKLWKNYFNNISIPERENKKLQMKFVPKKYWNFLNEMEEYDG